MEDQVYNLRKLAVEYIFHNPTLDDYLHCQFKIVGQKILHRALKDVLIKTEESNAFEIDSKVLKEQLRTLNPEEFVNDLTPSSLKLPEGEVKNFIIIFDTEYLERVSIVVTQFNQIDLFTHLIQKYFPTYHATDAQLSREQIFNRLPISLIPEVSLVEIDFEITQKFQSEYKECKLNSIIFFKDKIIPTRDRIIRLIKEYIAIEIRKCEHPHHVKLKSLYELFPPHPLKSNFSRM